MKRLRYVFAASLAGLGLAAAPSAGAETRMPASVTRPLDEDLRAEALERALMAASPYRQGSTEWELVTTSEQLMGKTRSGFDGALFRSGEEYSFMFYGYNKRNDLGDVIKAGFLGLPRRQLRDAEAFVEKAAATYRFAPAQAEFVGHSLGGYLAKAVGTHEGAPEVWAFNSPGFKKRDPRRLDRLFDGAAEGTGTQVYNFNSAHDVVGKWGRQPGHIYELETPQRHHTMTEMADALRRVGGEEIAAAPVTRPGPMARLFNRVATSKFVQRTLYRKFRDPGPGR